MAPIHNYLAVSCLLIAWNNAKTSDTCVPAGSTIAQVRELSGLPGSGVVESFAFVDGEAIVVVDGIAWIQNAKTCQWNFGLDMYDPSYYEDNFSFHDGQWHRKLDSGDWMPTSTEFSDDFETGDSVIDIINYDGLRYTSFVLLSPMAPTVAQYNTLRNCLMIGACDFLDNRIDFDPGAGRNGSQSIRFYSNAPTSKMITCKSLVERGLFFFRKGDTAWFSGWYKAQDTLPFTLLDFETSGIVQRPGIRLTIRNGALGAELKWLDKPQYLQESGDEVLFPADQWVHVRMRVLFSEDEFGEIEVWQNGVRILNQQGRTLATRDSVIDFVQIGITATSQQTTLHVDDIQVSATPIIANPPRRPPSGSRNTGTKRNITSKPKP